MQKAVLSEHEATCIANIDAHAKDTAQANSVASAGTRTGPAARPKTKATTKAGNSRDNYFRETGVRAEWKRGRRGGAWESGIMQACECGRMCESVPECARVGEWERVLFREWEKGNVGQCESGRMRECDSGGTED